MGKQLMISGKLLSAFTNPLAHGRLRSMNFSIKLEVDFNLYFLKNRFHTNLPLIGYQECNGLEEALEPLKPLTPTAAGSGLSFSTALTPFQIKSYSFSY